MPIRGKKVFRLDLAILSVARCIHNSTASPFWKRRLCTHEQQCFSSSPDFDDTQNVTARAESFEVRNCHRSQIGNICYASLWCVTNSGTASGTLTTVLCSATGR